MRFHEFLTRPGWTLRWRGDELDATQAARRCRQAILALRAQPPVPESLSIFVAFSPIEVVIALFVISHEGLLATIVTPRAVASAMQGFDTGTTRLLMTEGRPIPPVLQGCQVVRLPYAAPPASSNDDGAPLAPSAQPARIVFSSSGTTGRPKRIVHDEERLVANAARVTAYLGLTASDRTLCAFPVNYMYGLSTTLCTLHSGSAIDYIDFVDSRLVAVEAERRGTTILPILGDWCVGLAQQWARSSFVSADLRILNASDRLTVDHVRALRPHCGAIWNNFGQTEAGPRLFAIDVSSIEDFTRFEHDGAISAGYPMQAEIETRIADANYDGIGRLFYRSPYAMLGFLKSDLALVPAPEWIESGDHFRRDWDGLHSWAGRTSHLVKINGQLISLHAVADSLCGLHGVSGVGYAKTKEGVLVLFLEAADVAATQAERLALERIVEPIIPGFNFRLKFLPKLPRTESGKIDHRSLAQRIHLETI
ncbi:AMP-binding protein [Nguyenibacter vanlangensis]|uniref:AMP-binding protein n=1 Tax=Nguyenibacter vanlangensis TaxID=1216886 RepID=A0ABZ3D2U1_9PROT